MTCNHCGTPLKEIRVKVPVYLERTTMTEDGPKTEKVLARYDEETDYADCPQCMGAY